MSNEEILLESYVQKVNNWLPYPKERKNRLLENIRAEIVEAIQDKGNPDPVKAYGDPYQIAKGLSLNQDWGMQPAGWGIRVLAFLIDTIVIVSICLSYLVIGFILILRIDIAQALMIGELDEAVDILRADLELGPFLILIAVFLLYVLGAALIYSIYYVGLEKVYSATIGKKLLGLYAVDNSGIKLTWRQSIMRNITKFPGS